MAASVRIEDEAFSDDRYEDLAQHAGLADSDHARGKMARLWRQCTIEQTHVLSVATVVRVLGEHGVEALVVARLGEVTIDGVRIRGTHGRIEWLKKLRDNGKFGKRGGRPRKNPQGLPSKPTRVSENDDSETPPAPAPAPADPEDLSSPARAIPPSTEPEVVAVRGEMQPRERGRLAESTYARLSAARVEEGRRLGIPNVLAFPEVHPGRHPASFADLQLRIREEGINAARHCEVVIANLIAQCRETNSIEWLAEKSFTVGGWRTARNWQPGQQRAGPRFASRETKPEPPPVKVPTYR